MLDEDCPADIRATLRRGGGVILYRGPSLIDGAPIVAVAVGFAGSSNVKTGDMVQTYILADGVHPVVAAQTGADAAVCGACPHRPALYKAAGAARCYVNLGQGPGAVHRALERGGYMDGRAWSPDTLAAVCAGHAIRLGTYGDPAAVPVSIWDAMVARARSHTGYTHQWRDARFAALRTLCMASADSEAEQREAVAAGWRTFRVAPATGWAKLPGEGLCPASEEAGKRTTCAACNLCGGANGRAKASIVIPDHSTSGNAAKRRAARAAA